MSDHQSPPPQSPQSPPAALQPSGTAEPSLRSETTLGSGHFSFPPAGLPYLTLAPQPGGHPGSAPGAQFHLAVQQSYWQGPYPSPDAVERFEKLLPGSFDRILTMAEETQRAQIKTVENAQSFLQSDTKRSHYLGAAISFFALAGALTCGILNHPTVGVALVSIPVMAVAQAFLSGNTKSQETTTAASSPPTPG